LRLRYPLIPIAAILASLNALDAQTPTSQSAAIGDLASLLEGEFTTAPAPVDPTVAPPPAGRLLYHRSKRVQVAKLGSEVVYGELREGSPDGRVINQWLLALRPDDNSGRIRMTAYSFSNNKELLGAYANPAPLATVNPSELKKLPDGCEVFWRKTENGFEGKGLPGTCNIAPDYSGEVGSLNMTVSKTGLTEGIDTPAGPRPPTVFRRLH